mgnify:CR=1 FL=1
MPVAARQALAREERARKASRGEDGMEQVWAIPSDGIRGAALVQEVAGKGYESSSMPALKKG